MKILSVTLKGYKSINDSGNIEFNEKINIFAGKNNTGKTALIEAIYNSINGTVYDLLGDESGMGTDTLVLIEISVTDEDLIYLNKGMKSEETIVATEKLRITMSYHIEKKLSCINTVEGFYNGTYDFILTNRTKHHPANEQVGYSFYRINGGGKTVGKRPHTINNIFNLLKEKIIFINGTRHVPQRQATGLSHNLTIDGTNLNTFLYTLHNNEEPIFDQIKHVFKQIFNDVVSISTLIDESNSTYISLYFEGDDNPIPLYNCGSGFTHVLLLLCVLFTKKDSVVLFDEPHVFLHPSAEKAIYDIINETNYHQYLLTTHSPILINYAFDKNIFLVTKEKGWSNFSKLDDIQKILEDIGVSNSDFALSDKVLFVEGETEEAVIPQILSYFGMKQVGYNYRVLKMGGTGNEFTKKSAMARNHDKLQLILGGVSKSPIPYRIIIDLDEKDDEKVKELKEKYGKNIIILDRREFENYLLECYEELAEVINIDAGSKVTSDERVKMVIAEILAQTENRKLFPKERKVPLKNVVGSEVLELLFSEHKLSFNKVRHGVEITSLVLQKHPEKLVFFRDQLEEFINGNEVKVKTTVVQPIG
ncbi:AAA family ATPase [Priestia megaterium]